MAAQSEIGKQWGLPTRESMVLQGLGPNYLQGQKYAMNLGQTMPAATHAVGMPYIEKGKHGGIMGIQQSYGDITPAFLEPGEFVFTKKATDQLGADNLQRMMDDAERAYDGGLQRMNLGGMATSDTDEEDELEGRK